MADVYVLRPNGDGALTEWGTYTDCNQDVGAVGDITSVDTGRLASWGVQVTPWLDLETGALTGINSGSPPNDIPASQDLTWTNFEGPAGQKVTALQFRWASATVDLGAGQPNPYAHLEVYIDGNLIDTIHLSSFQNFIGTPTWNIAVREVEIVLPTLYKGSDIDNLTTTLKSVSTGYSYFLYALECRAVTGEKRISGVSGSEKQITVDYGLEKEIAPREGTEG